MTRGPSLSAAEHAIEGWPAAIEAYFERGWTDGLPVVPATADEVPFVYKNILDVMAEQSDLVDIVGRFDPKIVKMCGDGSKAED